MGDCTFSEPAVVVLAHFFDTDPMRFFVGSDDLSAVHHSCQLFSKLQRKAA